MKFLLTAALAGSMVMAGAMAQTQSGSMQMQSSGSQMKSGDMHSMSSMGASMHTMPATVTSVDQKSGLVEVNSAGMALKLHFPASSLVQVKAGDKITLHLGFTKP